LAAGVFCEEGTDAASVLPCWSSQSAKTHHTTTIGSSHLPPTHGIHSSDDGGGSGTHSFFLGLSVQAARACDFRAGGPGGLPQEQGACVSCVRARLCACVSCVRACVLVGTHGSGGVSLLTDVHPSPIPNPHRQTYADFVAFVRSCNDKARGPTHPIHPSQNL
jgi:hypothetical protein